MTRRYTAEIINVIGPEVDVPAPDMGTNEQVMAWVMDTYSQHKGHAVPGIVTGKPVAIGGTLGRREATGRGLVYTIIEAAKHLGIDLIECTAVVQGFGNVGSVVVKELANIGVKVIGVSDRTGGFFDANGLPVAKLLEVAEKNHSLEGCSYGEKISNAALLELKCDILVPAAMEMQITKENAGRLQCRLLAEGANGPTTLEADAILKEKGVFLIPDILANAGGVVVSYFEWVQNKTSQSWNAEVVDAELNKHMVMAASRTKLARHKYECDNMRTAAYCAALEQIGKALRACRKVLIERQ